MIWYMYMLQNDKHNKFINIHHLTQLQIFSCDMKELLRSTWQLSNPQYGIINDSHHAVHYIP